MARPRIHKSDNERKAEWLRQNGRKDTRRRHDKPYTAQMERCGHVAPVVIPPSVLADRDRRAALPQPMLGDPPPGRSALDQRRLK